MKNYLEELEKELRNKGLCTGDIEEIIKDHQEMIEEALSSGLDEADIYTKFGSPAKVADDLKDLVKLDTKNEENVQEYKLLKTFPILDEDISIEIAFINEDFHLEKSESDSIEVYYKGKGDISTYEFSYINQVFNAKAPKNFKRAFLRFRSQEFTFLIKVPSVHILNASLHSINSDITVDQLTVDRFKLKNTNGDVNFTNLNVKEYLFDTVNGDVEMTNVQVDSIKFSSVNGDVSMNNINVANDVFINTVSGDFEIKQMSCHECHFQTVSGDIDAHEFYPEIISLQSISGDISIRNQDESKTIQIKSKKSLSGSIKIS